jgi:prepilin-type processing-associated H-X9-DG protein
MTIRNRRAFTLFQLLIILAFLAILFALFLPALAKVRLAAARNQSANNLKQIGLAMHNYHDTHQVFPPGNDDNNFSALAYVLPYIEQAQVYQMIDFKKPIDDKANAAARKLVIKTFLDPRDGVKSVSDDFGPTNYLLCAGAKPALADNNGIFYQNSKLKITDISDGTSNTMFGGETLKGDSVVKATTVKRQYVLLKKDDLKDIKDDAGVKEWEKDKNIAADRGASWMDGRFLQSTFTGTRTLNDEKPDVNCAGFGGLSGLRSEQDNVNIAMADGSVHLVNAKMKLETWKLLADRADGQVLPPDF